MSKRESALKALRNTRREVMERDAHQFKKGWLDPYEARQRRDAWDRWHAAVARWHLEASS